MNEDEYRRALAFAARMEYELNWWQYINYFACSQAMTIYVEVMGNPYE